MEAVVTNCMLVKHWTGIHDVPKNVLDFKNLFTEASFWKYCWIRIKIQNSLDNDEGYEVMWMWIKKTWKTRKKESGLLMGWSGARRTCCWQRGLNRAALHHMMLGKGTARRRLQISKFNFRLGPSKKKFRLGFRNNFPWETGQIPSQL